MRLKISSFSRSDALKRNLKDPNNVLQIQDVIISNPCTWFHSIPPQILDTYAESNDWFLYALNNIELLNQGFSYSTYVNNLLGHDDDVAENNIEPSSKEHLEGVSQPRSLGNEKNLKQDVH